MRGITHQIQGVRSFRQTVTAMRSRGRTRLSQVAGTRAEGERAK
jgi:hypothetical protein